MMRNRNQTEEMNRQGWTSELISFPSGWVYTIDGTAFCAHVEALKFKSPRIGFEEEFHFFLPPPILAMAAFLAASSSFCLRWKARSCFHIPSNTVRRCAAIQRAVRNRNEYRPFPVPSVQVHQSENSKGRIKYRQSSLL